MRIAIYDNSLYINKQLVYLLKKYEEIKKICFSINSFHGNEVILSNKPNTDIAFLCMITFLCKFRVLMIIQFIRQHLFFFCFHILPPNSKQ